jgi:hypothetical protein
MMRRKKDEGTLVEACNIKLPSTNKIKQTQSSLLLHIPITQPLPPSNSPLVAACAKILRF